MLAACTFSLLAFTPQSTPDFPTARLLPDALNGEFRANGDFDGDGDVDLVHFVGTLSNWTGVRLFFNDGNGVFTPGPITPFGFPASYTQGTMLPFVGDFDGDGLLDFVIQRDGAAAAVGEGLEFFLGDGAGGWSARVHLLMSTPRWIAVGNMDGDAALEVAVDNIEPNFERRLGWVDFQGGAAVRLPHLVVTPGFIPNPTVFTVVDVDGNGTDDIAATATKFGSHDTLQFFPTVVGSPLLGVSFSTPLEMRNINHRIHSGDLDSDGDVDLLVIKMEPTDPGPWIQVYERTSTSWSQRPTQSVPTPTTGWIQPHTSGLVDWDGDGALDVFAGGQTLDVVRSTGALQFGEGFEAAASGQREGGGMCDVDGDGFVDFVGGFTVFCGAGTFVGHGGTALAFAPERIVDREGDGDVDLESASGGSIGRNDATGAFTTSQRSFPPIAGASISAPMARADFDGDGVVEYLSMYFEQFFPIPGAPFNPLGMLRFEDAATDTFQTGVPATIGLDIIPTPPVQTNDPHWGTGDIDGDGDVDLLLNDGYRENDGSGLLSVFVSAYTGRGRLVADFDGDTLTDLVTTTTQAGSTFVVVWYGTPTGLAALPLATVPGAARVRADDLDADGDLDLMVAAPGTLGLELFENVGGFFTSPPIEISDAYVPYLDTVAVRDVDGDGELDLGLLLRRTSSGGWPHDTAALFLGSGTALGYQLADEHLVPVGTTSVADVDADGDLDTLGQRLLRGTRAANAGAVRQFGSGGSGTGGISPLLGAVGPIVSTSTSDELRVTRGLGGAPALLGFSFVETSVSHPNFPGLLIHVGAPILLPLPPLSGAPGAPGEGTFTLTLPDVPAFAGFTFILQVFITDPAAPSGLSGTNGLALTFGA